MGLLEGGEELQLCQVHTDLVLTHTNLPASANRMLLIGQFFCFFFHNTFMNMTVLATCQCEWACAHRAELSVPTLILELIATAWCDYRPGDITQVVQSRGLF